MPQLRTAVSIPVAATLLLLVTACGPRPQIL
jgi:hypothetical protein